MVGSVPDALTMSWTQKGCWRARDYLFLDRK
jgi:hypothetical protein